MSDEIKVTEEKKEECKCFCRSEGVRKFLIVAIGSFVGVYFALSLFAFVHRPPVPPCPFGPQGGFGNCPVQVIHHKQFRCNGDFHKRMMKEPRSPFEAQRPEANH